MRLRKLLVIPVIAVLFFYSCVDEPKEIVVDVHELTDTSHRIILMHPTVNNINTFLYLTQNEIFPLPENYKVVGVYHSKGRYNYRQTVDLIIEEDLNSIKLVEIKPELDPDRLYEQNELTALFNVLFDRSNSVIFFGGPDIPPQTYESRTNLLTVITDVHRHYLELSYLFHLTGGYQDTLYTPFMKERPDYRVLGLCLGMQTMNVATGGTLIQDIPTELYNLTTVEDVLDLEQDYQHRNYHIHYAKDPELIRGNFHRIAIKPGSVFDTINEFSSNLPYVWSSHHQSIDKPGKGIIPVAWSTDKKVVEAIVHSEYPNYIGVQFHPEVPAIFDPDEKLNQLPLKPAEKSYIEMFPGEKGEDFHRNFWKHFGEKF